MNNTISGFERLSGDYNRGYTKAIQDIIDIFKYIQPDLKYHRKSLNAKNAISLLKCCLQNRANIRDNIGSDGFIRWNCITNNFEYFSNSDRK